MMKHFDAEHYTISVRKEVVEGDELYVARITELPDIEEFGESYQEARELALDSIQTSYELCMENGIVFPQPMVISDEIHSVSGRITLRMPKTLHAKLNKEAALEDVSLNQYLVSALSMHYGQYQITDALLNEIKTLRLEINKYQKAAATYLFKEYVNAFQPQETSNWVVDNKRGLLCKLN